MLAPVRSHAFSYGLKIKRDPDRYEFTLRTIVFGTDFRPLLDNQCGLAGTGSMPPVDPGLGCWQLLFWASLDHANLAAVGRVLRRYSEQYSGFQTVIVLYGLPILKEMAAWRPGHQAYGREIRVESGAWTGFMQ